MPMISPTDVAQLFDKPRKSILGDLFDFDPFADFLDEESASSLETLSPPVRHFPDASPEEFIQALETAARQGLFVMEGACLETVDVMHAEFPRLRKVWGWINCSVHPQWPHWYLRDDAGTVHDPTRSQFEKIYGYGEWPPDEPRPIGRCVGCLELLYSDRYGWKCWGCFAG